MAVRHAARVDAMRSFQVMDLLDRARVLESQGRNVVHMEVGEPDFSSATTILEAGQRALEAGETRYTSALGLPALRQGLAAWYRRWHGAEVDPECIVITAGATGALVLLAGLLLEEGDEVLMADPCYPCNRQFPLLVGAQPRLVPAPAASDYQLDARSAAEHWTQAARGALLASPANPTGSMVSSAQLRELVQFVESKSAFLIVDEIYQGLTFPSDLTALPDAADHGVPGNPECPTSVLSLFDTPRDELYVVNSFSKYFGMTGWRVGWLVAPPDSIPALEKLAQNFYIAPSTPGQHAAVEALSDASMMEHERRRRVFCQRRNLLVAGLRQVGFDVPLVPEGAFYVYARLPDGVEDSFAFCTRLLEEHGVAATPGTDFGDFEAERHVRFAATADEARLAAGLDRIALALGAGS